MGFSVYQRATWALLLIGALGGCVERSSPGYPAAYRAALETQRGIDPIPEAYVDAFVDLFQGPHGPATVARARVLYAPDVYFSDTLTSTHLHAAVIDHFERLQQARACIVLTVHDRIYRGEDVYLVWSMGAAFEAGQRDIETDTIGVSHLRFNGAGQIVLQQDFWDAAHGFYQHLPVLGAAVRRIGNEFDSP